MIVILQLGLREFRWDFDTVAPPHDHYCADSGSKLIIYAQTLAPNDARCQGPYWQVLSAFFYSGRKWRRVFDLFFTVYEREIELKSNEHA